MMRASEAAVCMREPRCCAGLLQMRGLQLQPCGQDAASCLGCSDCFRWEAACQHARGMLGGEGEGGGGGGTPWAAVRLRLACLGCSAYAQNMRAGLPQLPWQQCLLKSRLAGQPVVHMMPVLVCLHTPAKAAGEVCLLAVHWGRPACCSPFLPLLLCCIACFRWEPACLLCLRCLSQAAHCHRLPAWRAICQQAHSSSWHWSGRQAARPCYVAATLHASAY